MTHKEITSQAQNMRDYLRPIFSKKSMAKKKKVWEQEREDKKPFWGKKKGNNNQMQCTDYA